MAETTVHPPGQPRADTVVAQPPMSQYQALRQLGCITGIDFILLALILGTFVTLFFWLIFGHPSWPEIAVSLVVAAGLFHIWSILLLFRTIRFVLDINAYLNTLPQEAARIVMAAYAGRR